MENETENEAVEVNEMVEDSRDILIEKAPEYKGLRNCTFIGYYAGANYTDEDIDSVVLIGDNVRSLTDYPKGSIGFGFKVIIGPYLFGQRTNIKELYLSYTELSQEKREELGKKVEENYSRENPSVIVGKQCDEPIS